MGRAPRLPAVSDLHIDSAAQFPRAAGLHSATCGDAAVLGAPGGCSCGSSELRSRVHISYKARLSSTAICTFPGPRCTMVCASRRCPSATPANGGGAACREASCATYCRPGSPRRPCHEIASSTGRTVLPRWATQRARPVYGRALRPSAGQALHLHFPAGSGASFLGPPTHNQPPGVAATSSRSTLAYRSARDHQP